ncbi:winged helix-turn-helix transcriptional regulator [Corallibacter sp.]|uniref:winged helix-turn-helix transcriptional regulator n=1 Tax=Corallibacter sp. TaxID=2038084 RepID=UPI003AB1F824
MTKTPNCPINQSLYLIGDRWTLLILRDIMFFGKRHFNDFLSSKEKIAKSVLNDRLKKLIENRIIVKAPDHSHKQKNKYTLNYRGIDLIPLMIELYKWNGYRSGLSEQEQNFYNDIHCNRISFEDRLKKDLTLEIKSVFNNNHDLFMENIRKISPIAKTTAEWKNERDKNFEVYNYEKR